MHRHSERIIGGVDIPEDLGLAKPGATRYTTIIPKHVFIPMQQSSGKPCEPVVKPGNRVRLGQVIGETDEKIGSFVHASVSGTVIEVDEMKLASGKDGTTVIIENDMQDTPVDSYGTPNRLENRNALLDTVKQMGIVGMGGATFPSHIKMDLEEADNIDFLLVNGAECEPLLSSDEVLMCDFTDQVVRGAQIVCNACGVREVIAGVEEDMPDALECLKRAKHDGMNFRVESLPRHYPMGGEKQLIQFLTGREYPVDKMPKDVGVLVFNVATLAALADAADRSVPLTRRICTVAGDVKNPANVLFPVGTLAKDMIEYCGGFSGDASLIILGGPMMGKSLASLDVPLTKSSNGLVIINERHDTTTQPEYPCIHCNRCADACPMRLLPQMIDARYRDEDWDMCRTLHADSCIDCGCCTYVCPSAISLAEHAFEAGKKIKQMKKEEKQKTMKKQADKGKDK